MLKHHILFPSLILAAVASVLASQDGPLAVGPTPEAAKANMRSVLEVPATFPGQANAFFYPTTAEWPDIDAISGEVVLPDDAPKNLQIMAFLKDRDSHWFQTLREERVGPGTNRWEFAIDPLAEGWEPQGHHGAWHHRLRITPAAVGIRIFTDAGESYTGVCAFVQNAVTVCTNRFAAPPEFLSVRTARDTVPCQDCFEVVADITDRHTDPFDFDKAWLRCEIVTPSGATNTIDGFYYEPYYRVLDEMGGELVPDGHPDWRARFCPREPGEYTYRLVFRDEGGETEWGPAKFTATPAPEGAPRFVRVSTNDFRHLEFDDGTFFFPIGHNIRSPFDTRMDDQFPWRFRHPEGSEAYLRYIRDMHKAGENLVEIWMCAWSLGIEWSRVINGYHGVGDYHLGNAWELDEVLGWARKYDMHVNLILNNHGRASEWCDQEWQDSPYCRSKGGFLEHAMDFFGDPRALALQKQLDRYIVARWGWSPSIYAWELWSEGNLCGNGGHQRCNFDPSYIEWHKQIGDLLHQYDPNHHLVTTHVSGDYNSQNPGLCMIPQLDACAVDAYHNSPDPLHIVNLVRATAEFNNRFGKPVLITEFGGSPMAADEDHLRRELHAALWSSACAPVAGGPLFWWWQLVEEADFYPIYTHVAKFMEDVDRRDTNMVAVTVQILDGDERPVHDAQIGSICMASKDLALGWMFLRQCFQRNGMPLEKPMEELTVVLNGRPDGVYRVEFWDPSEGKIVQRHDQRSANGRMIIDVPPLSCDLAFKVRPLYQ